MIKDIAIIGGGIAGLYTAWRLLEQNEADPENPEGSPREPKYRVHLYEKEQWLGGRIRSQEMLPLTFRAELGAMRFRRSHLLLSAVLRKHHIPAREFNLPSPVFYVRGRRFTTSEIKSGRCLTCNGEGPFHLKPCEQGMSAVDLIRYAITELLNALNFPLLHQGKARQLKRKIRAEDFDDETWYYIKEEGTYQGLHLYQIGFWNLLQHFLSNEAYVMVHDVLSLESILGNWNAAEAIPWFLADFQNDQFDMVPGGLSRVAEELELAIEELKKSSSLIVVDSGEGTRPLVEVYKAHCVQKLERSGGKWKLSAIKYERVHGKLIEAGNFDREYDSVILALPPAAILDNKLTVTFENTEQNKWPPKWLSWVEGHRMIKIFLLYAEPWWMGDSFPGYDTGRIFTDLPLRQVYHFSPTWMQSHGERQSLDGQRVSAAETSAKTDEGGLALVMASYSDDHYVSFWGPMLGADPLLDLCVGHDHPYIQPSPKLKPEVWDKLKSKLQSISQDRPDLLAKRRMVEKVHLMLQEIHGREIPHPVLGIAQAWDAGWHTWVVGSKPWEKSCRRESVQPCKDLYLCGEALSPEQGWIEGALKSSEQVLKRMGVGRHKWLRDLHIDLDIYIDPFEWLDRKERTESQRSTGITNTPQC